MLSSKSAYSSLLNFFSSSAAASPAAITHPDQRVNAMTEGREEDLRKAAVLIPVTRESADSASEIVLTVRAADLNSHPGQISLPGGSMDHADENLIATALRESEEEIGLDRNRVEVIGQLGDLALPSGFHVTPVVGLIESGMEYKPCPIEVADIFHAPLNLILEPGSYKKSERELQGQAWTVLELHHRDYRIWGATAAILYHLANQVHSFTNH